jgi:hypothetical protein
LDGDQSITGDDNLVSHATQYYKTLFGPGTGNALEINPNMWPLAEMVTDEESDELIKPFSEEEIKKALFQMEKNKAAGPNGYPIEFYQGSWNFIKPSE